MDSYSPNRSEDNSQIHQDQNKYFSLIEDNHRLERELKFERQQNLRNALHYKQKNDLFEDELDTYKDQNSQLRDDLTKARREINDVAKQLDKVRMERDKLKRDKEKLIVDNEAMEEEIKRFKNQKKMLYDRVQDINKSVLETNDKLKVKDKLLQQSQNQRRILEKSNNELKLQLEQFNEQIRTKSQKIQDLEECVQSHLQNHLNSANSHGKLISQINELTEIKNLQSQKINQYEQENLYMRERLLQFEQEFKNKENQTKIDVNELQQKMLEIKNVMSGVGMLAEKIRMVKETKLKIQRDVKGAMDHLERVSTSIN